MPGVRDRVMGVVTGLDEVLRFLDALSAAAFGTLCGRGRAVAISWAASRAVSRTPAVRIVTRMVVSSLSRHRG